MQKLDNEAEVRGRLRSRKDSATILPVKGVKKGKVLDGEKKKRSDDKKDTSDEDEEEEEEEGKPRKIKKKSEEPVNKDVRVIFFAELKTDHLTKSKMNFF